MTFGRGVHYLPGIIDCPFAELGTRAANLSNRLALDDEHSRATFDAGTRTLRIENVHAYPRKSLVGDLLLLGTGTTADGRTVPLAFHTRFDKKGDRFDARPHLHPSENARLVGARCEPLKVVVCNGRRETLVLDDERIERAWRNPPMAERLGRALIEVREAADTDLEVRIGLGRFSRGAVRVRLAELDDGSWEFRLDALMGLPSARDHVRRALFLLGLDGASEALSVLATQGLSKGETLVFRTGTAKNSLGSLRVHGRELPIEGAADVARAYLEFDFVGAILASRLRGRREKSIAL